jgi:hypothetical protein
MTASDLRRLRQTSMPCDHASFLAAFRLARIARDQFWAARRAGDRPAMIRWSVRENALRRRAHGLTAMSRLPARARAAA